MTRRRPQIQCVSRRGQYRPLFPRADGNRDRAQGKAFTNALDPFSEPRPRDARSSSSGRLEKRPLLRTLANRTETRRPVSIVTSSQDDADISVDSQVSLARCLSFFQAPFDDDVNREGRRSENRLERIVKRLACASDRIARLREKGNVLPRRRDQRICGSSSPVIRTS